MNLMMIVFDVLVLFLLPDARSYTRFCGGTQRAFLDENGRKGKEKPDNQLRLAGFIRHSRR
jgi:hypothetical protein